MTYIKYEQRHLSDERWLEAGSDAFALHTWALAYCDEQSSDGFISMRMAERVAFPLATGQVADAIDVLLRLGFWRESELGYVIVDYGQHCLAADEKAKVQAKWANDKRRQRLHNIGTHDLCTERTCLAKQKASTEKSTLKSTEASTLKSTGGQVDSIPNQNRPDPSESGSVVAYRRPPALDDEDAVEDRVPASPEFVRQEVAKIRQMLNENAS